MTESCNLATRLLAAVLWGVVLLATAQSPAPLRVVRGGVRSALYPDNWQPGYRDAQGRFLHDFSYAGYHHGEKPLPSGNHSRVFDVSAPPYHADRTGATDATAAVQQAIKDAGAAGGGIVFLPAGTYRLLGGLRLYDSRVVLRGAGSEGEQATRLLFEDGGSGWMDIYIGGKRKEGEARPLGRDGRIFEQSVTLDDVSGLAPGDDIEIGWTITKAWIAEHGMAKYWTARRLNRHRGFFQREITRVEPGARRIWFKVPLRYPVRVRDKALVKKVTGYVEECGVEHLAVCNARHNEEDAWTPKPGSGVIGLRTAKNCWVRDVRSFESPACPPFHLRSCGIHPCSSKTITVADCHLAWPQNRGGAGNGYLFSISGCNEVLVRDCTGRYGRHNFNFNAPFGDSGHVLLRVHSSDGMGYGGWAHRKAHIEGKREPYTGYASDFHHSLAIACLIDEAEIDDEWRALNRTSMSDNAGHTCTQCVFWNCRGKARIRSFQYGWGYVIGTEGLNVETKGTFGSAGTEPADFTEHIGSGSQLSVKSLYEDQLARRLAETRHHGPRGQP
ncbi:MAG: hypothetical protein JXR37_09430 [Kiritimatiellae bacterium]|nr:hypothetical protein [Kiritimatiellia bacterium]